MLSQASAPIFFLGRGTVFGAPRSAVIKVWGELRAMLPKVYRSHAAECLRCAMVARDPESRAALRRMAIAWIDLAEKAERNQRNDMVYEPPERARREG
jgi:hypothetical protein